VYSEEQSTHDENRSKGSWCNSTGLHLRRMQQAPKELLELAIHRLSTRFSPTLRQSGEQLAGLNALLRGGFVRQSSAGVFSLLPNGERVRQKIENIIDQEMHRIGGLCLKGVVAVAHQRLVSASQELPSWPYLPSSRLRTGRRQVVGSLQDAR
jgi:hypothetical protein